MLKEVVAGPRSEIKFLTTGWGVFDDYNGYYEHPELTTAAEQQLRQLAALTYDILPADLTFSDIFVYERPRKIGDRGWRTGRLNLSFNSQGRRVQKQWHICQTPGKPAAYFFQPGEPADVGKFILPFIASL